MPCLVTREAPDFTARAVMPDNSFKDLTLSSFRGKYVILFFYPMDFTFVCPTEILAFDGKLHEFKKRDCEVIGVSTDTEYSHFAWKSLRLEEGGIGGVQFPIVADITKNITREYGILHGNSVAMRGLFLLDKHGIVRHELVNDLPLGRSVDEALRMLDALKFYEKKGEVCPADWHPGENAVKPDHKGISDYLAHRHS